MQTSVCPSPEQLKAYVRGKLDSEQSDILSQHTLHCASCERTIVQIEAEPDTLVELLKCDLAVSAAVSQPGGSPNTRQDALQMPTELGQYELQRRLGAGGMGAVYLARHKSLDKQVAIKLLPALPAQHPGFLARFQREMRAAGKLDHPAIVRTTDAGELQGIHFLVMEAIDGMDLSRIVRVEEKLSIADACEIVRQAAIGLAHAHEKGIVHRDVKPSNLMLDVNGQVRILDFGLAQVGLWDSGSAEITTVGQLMGTLDYMAPEQAERGGAVDYRADLYSLGATLFRLLTGRAPLAAAPNLTPLEKLRLLASHKPPKLRSLRGDVPEALSQIVDAMLSREPAQRPASATHAAELLEPFGAGAELVGLLSRAQSKPPVDECSFSINPLLQRDLASASTDHNMHQPKDRSDPWRDQLRLDQSKSRLGRLGRWLTGTAVAGSLAMVCAGVLFILETSKGQLVIDSQADVQVKIVAIDESGKRSDVDELQISPGSKATRLKSGKYEITLDAASDSFGVTNGAFTIRNGQTVVATITPKSNTASSGQIGQSDTGARQANAEDPRLNEVVYDGQTLDTWIRRLKFERNEAEVERTLMALIALADPSLRDVMLSPVFEFAKRPVQSHFRYVAILLSKLCGPSLPETSARLLSEFSDEETKEWFFTPIRGEIGNVGTQGFSEFLAETKKLLASKSQNRSISVAFELRQMLRDIAGRGIPTEIQSQIVQMFVETPQLTDENFWLAYPSRFNDSSSEAMSQEIIKRAIDRLRFGDMDTSETLKCQSAIVLGSLLEEKTPGGEKLKLSVHEKERLTQSLSADIAKLNAEPIKVNSTVKMPQQFADFVAAKLTFPSSLRTVGNTGRDTIASPYVLRMHLIDTCGLKEALIVELRDLHHAMRQLPIGGPADRFLESPVLYHWDMEVNYRSLLGHIVYLQSGALLDIPNQELRTRFEEKLPADLACDLDEQLDLLGSRGGFGFVWADLEKLPLETSSRAGLVLEKAALKHSNDFGNVPQFNRLWMRASGEDFLASYARVLASEQSRLTELTTDAASYPSQGSQVLIANIGQYPQLRCASPDKLQPILSFCDKAIKNQEAHKVQSIAQMLRSLADSVSPNFSTECRELVIQYLVSNSRLDEINFWLEAPIDQQASSRTRVATITKAIERLTSDSDPLDVVDCQALIAVGGATNEDWKEIPLGSQQKLVDVLRQQLVAAVQDRTTSAKLVQLPSNFSPWVVPLFAVDAPFREHSYSEDVRTNHIILTLNFIAKSAINLPNQAREKLLSQVEALHETVAKLNLTDSTFNTASSQGWKDTVNRQQPSSLNQLIWHTWYTQTGVLLGKPYNELNGRPAKFSKEEYERKRRFVQPGDTLAIYIPMVLPTSGDPPVIQAGKSQPVTGFPVPVSKDGAIELPYIGQLVVKDLELPQVLAAIEETYTSKQILDPKGKSLGITVQFLLRSGSNLELRNIAGSQIVTVPTK